MSESCVLCQFFDKNWDRYRNDTDYGDCRRRSPSVVESDKVVYRGFKDEYARVSDTEWPSVRISDWCGEFKVKTDSTDEASNG